MGNKEITPQLIEEVQRGTYFSKQEVRTLLRRFRKMDKQSIGTVPSDVFLSIPELSNNAYAKRILTLFETEKLRQINYVDFIRVLGIFHNNSNADDKCQLYDLDGDGFINKKDLFSTLKLIVGSKMTESHLADVVDKTMVAADTDKDGKLSLEEFKRVVVQQNIK